MDLSSGMAALVLMAVVIGAILQRVSGTGMGLVLAPVLTLLVGPGPGVLITNATTMVSALLLMLAMRQDIEWRRALLIMACVPPGAIVGALVVKNLSVAWLQVTVGAVVLGAIGITVLMTQLGKLPHVRTWWITPLAGTVGGMLNTVAGVSAPVVVVHARLVRWTHRNFAASMQPVFMTMGAASVASKTVFGSVEAGLPPVWVLPAALLAVLVGIALGGYATKRISASHAATAALVIAGLGGLSAMIRGLATLL
ncbi:MAG: sulfite exporter TauE/SafE family protein [Ornithinimicrobium sp.]|uniref:sulfite exporter TauE/SafE family protein n=1 Tax=Ornithinimicrobium sp. TaxID=1977084 RepID=UPI0026DFB739|nr:sulfite exporter TauE/SafE family protein [Ornithinimicrobium sp.]MDO5738800.1 sulfite exporter TauE/SafE family protein [Ornithinimicrobium sp.]